MNASRASARDTGPDRAGWPRWSLLVALVAFLSACQQPKAPAPETPDFQIIGQGTPVVVLLDESFAGRGHSANRGRAVQMSRGMGVTATHAYGTALCGFAASVPQGRIDALRRDPRVR